MGDIERLPWPGAPQGPSRFHFLGGKVDVSALALDQEFANLRWNPVSTSKCLISNLKIRVVDERFSKSPFLIHSLSYNMLE